MVQATEKEVNELAKKLMNEDQAKLQSSDPKHGTRAAIWLDFPDYVAKARQILGLPQIPNSHHDHG